MTRLASAGALALILIAAGCQKAADDPSPTASPTASAASPVATFIASPSAETAASPCPFGEGRNKEWDATIDTKPPVSEGGRPLGVKGKVEVTVDGQSAMLTPGALDAAGQHFTLELSPDASSEKGWREVSTSVYPAPDAAKAIVDCGGTVLQEIAVEKVN